MGGRQSGSIRLRVGWRNISHRSQLPSYAEDWRVVEHFSSPYWLGQIEQESTSFGEL